MNKNRYSPCLMKMFNTNKEIYEFCDRIYESNFNFEVIRYKLSKRTQKAISHEINNALVNLTAHLKYNSK